jgi:ATP-dependent Lhr-like helicase
VTSDPFADLQPAIQYHVLNSLGWTRLRPLQQESIRPVLRGDDALLIAPTAGGKTEAAMLPLLSRMDAERWYGLSVVYVCPLRALLNNLEPRLSLMAGWLGRRVALWHGDVTDSVKRRLATDPPDILLTTPESLEGMLISGRVDHTWAFGTLRTVVVDELHAFAGDDRGWHLLGVLSRLSRVARHPLQRIGLSATIGNPQMLLDWLADGSPHPRIVVNPPSPEAAAPEIQLDHAGSLQNAAIVIARLHQGAKRLVFCDSRAQAEKLAVALRSYGVTTYVSHSSLSADARRQTEAAFTTGSNCVIVATSTLELGIDIGDLDHVIQIDAPGTVASFLQRLGRTGRRPGTARNALFLTTRDETLWAATALLLLWQRGYVEPVIPPTLPRHIVAQQILGLVLQERQVVRADIQEWLGGLADTPGVSETLCHLIAEEFLIDLGELITIGPRAEQEFGRRFFRDLTSAFTSEPSFTAFSGREALGELPALVLASRRPAGPLTVLLGGRSWTVRQVDWRARRVSVEPSDRPGFTHWAGTGRVMSYPLARAHHDVLTGSDPAVGLSRRAREGLADLRRRLSFADTDPSLHANTDPGGALRTYLVHTPGKAPIWWTFAGHAANATLSDGLPGLVDCDVTVGPLRMRMRPEITASQIRVAIEDGRDRLIASVPSVDDQAVDALKFSAAVPRSLAVETVSRRLSDPGGVSSTVDSVIWDVRLTT